MKSRWSLRDVLKGKTPKDRREFKAACSCLAEEADRKKNHKKVVKHALDYLEAEERLARSATALGLTARRFPIFREFDEALVSLQLIAADQVGITTFGDMQADRLAAMNRKK